MFGFGETLGLYRPPVTHRVRRFRRRFPESLRRVTVRSHVSLAMVAGRWLHGPLCGSRCLACCPAAKRNFPRKSGVLKEKLEAAEGGLQGTARRSEDRAEWNADGRDGPPKTPFPGSGVGSGKCQSQGGDRLLRASGSSCWRRIPQSGSKAAAGQSKKSPRIPIRYRLLIGFVPASKSKISRGESFVVVSYALAGKDQALPRCQARSGDCQAVWTFCTSSVRRAFKKHQGAN